jgi:hypothetical protein
VRSANASSTIGVERKRSVHSHLSATAYVTCRTYGCSDRADTASTDRGIGKALVDGREVLVHIKGDDSLRAIPTVVLATSEVGNLKFRLRGSPQCARRLDPFQLLTVLTTKLTRVLQVSGVRRRDVGVSPAGQRGVVAVSEVHAVADYLSAYRTRESTTDPGCSTDQHQS